MANRRMFSKDVVDSDKFLDMPPTAQNLYFHLGIHADDDGFVSSPKKVQRSATASNDDLTSLISKGFIIPFETGVVVITDWHLNNQIRKDRYKETIYQEEKANLLLTNGGKYDFVNNANQMATSWQPNDNQMETQYRLGKESIGKGSREEGLKKIYHYYESNGFGTLAQKTMQDFDYWITDFEKLGATQENAVELIIYALGIAIDRNKRNYGYANAILKDWEQNKYLSVKDVEANDMMREQKKIIEEQKSNTGHSEYDDLGF
ncbi:hypothetical protein IGL01_002325 [Enterococcus sp. DIV0340]|uniref:DnaD domain-containing protein n=1 Tax=unclassified Enterococcus TaxID=2608891 RepID=UPI003D2FD98C